MFSKIQVGETVFVEGQEYPVSRVSNARFWVKVGDEEVKFIKSSGKEYGAGNTRKATREAEPVEAEAPAEVAVEAEAEAPAAEEVQKPKRKRTRKAKAAPAEAPAEAEAPAAEEVVEEAAAPTE